MQISSTSRIAIIGNVFLHGKEQFSSLLIENGRIASLEKGRINFEDARVIELNSDDVVFPGMINLHTHNEYNIYPLWQSPARWSSRHQWRKNSNYKLFIRDFNTHVNNKYKEVPRVMRELLALSGLSVASLDFVSSAALDAAASEVFKVLSVITEMQAVAGGTTTIEQGKDLVSEKPDARTFIIRNTAAPEDFGFGKIVSEVDFYRPKGTPTGDPDEDTAAWSTDDADGIKRFRNDLLTAEAKRYATLAHIGEGRTGNLLSKVDPYSRREIDQMISEFGDNSKLKEAKLNLVHANGCDWKDKKTLEFLKKNNIGVIWSPVSNLLLYGDTLPVEILIGEGINVALGSDWAPSGSKHVFDELKFARYYTDVRGIAVPDIDIFKMVTANPASMLGIEEQVAEIKEGSFADLFVIRKNGAANALSQLFDLNDTSIQFTMVNGRVVYGDRSVFKMLNVDFDHIPDSEGESVNTRGVSLNKAINVNLETMLPKLDVVFYDYVKDKLKGVGVRTKMLATDDAPYQSRIEQLRRDLTKM